ncbi:MAG: ABC transporter substrate-binding protein [Leptothrix sp. (in: b-proteobacteria)]
MPIQRLFRARWLACLLGTLAAIGPPGWPGGRGAEAHAAVTAVAPVAAPQRIVSLMPSLTESVCALGACDRLVGVDRYSNWPASIARLPRLGGLEDAQVEAIVALKPDLVLAPRSSRAIGRLESLGLRVVTLEPVDQAELRASLDTLSALLGLPGAGAALWQRIDAQLAQAAAQVAPPWRGQRVYVEVDSAPYAAGERSFVGQTLARLGLANIVPAALGPFPKLNPEFVLRAQPDLVIAAARDLATMASRPGWSQLRALQQGRQCGFDAAQVDLLVRPGPRLGEGALLLSRCLSGLAAPMPAAPANKSPAR